MEKRGRGQSDTGQLGGATRVARGTVVGPTRKEVEHPRAASGGKDSRWGGFCFGIIKMSKV